VPKGGAGLVHETGAAIDPREGGVGFDRSLLWIAARHVIGAAVITTVLCIVAIGMG
jgi:hypothetical protein